MGREEKLASTRFVSASVCRLTYGAATALIALVFRFPPSESECAPHQLSDCARHSQTPRLCPASGAQVPDWARCPRGIDVPHIRLLLLLE